MRDIKKLVLLICIILILMIIFLIALIIVKSDTTNTLDEVELIDEGTYNPEGIENTLQEMQYKSDFYSVKNCIEKLYSYYAEIFNPDAEDSEGAKTAVYNMLDEKYKTYRGITESNIKEKIGALNQSKVNINEMYVNQKSENIYVYIAKGRLRELNSGKISSFELIITQDTSNSTFTVILDDYVKEYYSEIVLGEELKIEIPETIEVNDYNKYDYQIIDDETYLYDLIAKYKDEMLFDVESAYNHLDKDYREKRFESLEDFKTYAKNNTYKNVVLKLDQYKKKVYDEYTEYVCIDQNNNYYIFREKAVMNYGMILDTYTVELPDFITTYDSADTEQKVGLNINKIITAINEKDYKYVYSKLNTTYKNTYFSDYNTFAGHVKNNFFESNDISVEKFDSVGQNTYTTKLKLTNKKDSTQTGTTTITLRLLENRDFEMSFAIQ